MLNKKGKRKLEYDGRVFYWFVRIDDAGHRIHIISEEGTHWVYPFLDTEVPVTPGYIRSLLRKHDSVTETG